MKPKKSKIVDFVNLEKIEETGAIVNTNTSAFLAAKNKKMEYLANKNAIETIPLLESRISAMETKLDSILSLLENKK